MRLWRPRELTAPGLLFRLLVAGALVVDAVVHLQLAPLYDQAAPGGVGQGNLFRFEACLALVAAVLVVLTGSQASFVLATLVAATGLAALVVYRYVDLPAVGPIPRMYEPVWFPKKVIAAAGETAGALLGAIAATQATLQARRARRSPGIPAAARPATTGTIHR